MHKSQTGGADIVAAWPKYSAARRGAKVYRMIGKSPVKSQTFLFFFFVVAVNPQFSEGNTEIVLPNFR